MLRIGQDMVNDKHSLDVLIDGEYVMLGDFVTIAKAKETFKDNEKIIAFFYLPFIETDTLYVVDKDTYIKYWRRGELKGEDK